MGRIFTNGETQFESYVMHTSGPIDTRMVVKEKQDLIDESTWKLEQQTDSESIIVTYPGQIVAVVNSGDSYGNQDNGIWYLTDKTKWNCFDNGEPGNIGGWKKLASLPLPPNGNGTYYLTVNVGDGGVNYSWNEDTDADVLIDDETIKRLVINDSDEHTRTENPDLDNALFVAKADGGEF